MVINNIHMILVLPLTITIPLLFLSLLTFFLYSFLFLQLRQSTKGYPRFQLVVDGLMSI